MTQSPANPQRMSDERFAALNKEYQYSCDVRAYRDYDEILNNHRGELLQALKAERARLDRVDAEAQSWRDLEPVAGNYYANRVQLAIHPAQEPKE